MPLPDAYAAYNRNKVLTASPAELTLMLYEGAIKFCNIAIVGIENKDIEKAHTNIIKTEKIIYGSWLPSTNYIVDENWNFELYVGNDCYLYIPIKN